MAQEIFKKGGAIDQRRIERIETIITRLARRSHRIASALVTPYPISNAVIGEDVRGVILRYLFPCKGKITTGFIKLDKKPAHNVEVGIRLFNDITSNSTKLILNKKISSVQSDLEVFPGDCFEVTFTPSVLDTVKEVWASILWVPNGRVVDVQQFLIDELDKLTEEVTAEE